MSYCWLFESVTIRILSKESFIKLERRQKLLTSKAEPNKTLYEELNSEEDVEHTMNNITEQFVRMTNFPGA